MQRQQWQIYEEIALDQVFGFDKVLHTLDYKWGETNKSKNITFTTIQSSHKKLLLHTTLKGLTAIKMEPTYV